MTRYYIYKLYFTNGATYIGCHIQHKENDNYITSSTYYSYHKNELEKREILIYLNDEKTMDIMETLLILRDKCENPKNVNGNYGNWFGKLPADGSSRRGKPISEEHRHKLSESHKGKIPWNKGMKMKPMSDEQKQKISNTLKGKTVSEETRKKLSIAAKNRPYKKLSDNHKQKISVSSKNWWNNSSEEERNRRNEKISSKLKGIKRKPHTEEWKRNMSEKLKGRKMSDEFRKKMSEVAREREAKKRLSKEK